MLARHRFGGKLIVARTSHSTRSCVLGHTGTLKSFYRHWCQQVLRMSRRFIMRIELTGGAKQKLSTLSDKNGMTQVAMMSRLVEWFAGQNELIQAAVLG